MRSRVLIVTARGLAAIRTLAVPSARATATKVTATAGRDDLPFKDSTRILGRVTGHPGGDGGLAVELEADPTRTFNEVVETRVRYQSPGRAQIVIRSRHPADLHWAGRRARWYSSRGSTAGGFTATYPGRSLTLYVIPT